jgi:hypothetical protein
MTEQPHRAPERCPIERHGGAHLVPAILTFGAGDIDPRRNDAPKPAPRYRYVRVQGISVREERRSLSRSENFFLDQDSLNQIRGTARSCT